LSTRLNQEALEIAVSSVSASTGNVRLNQEAILLGVNSNSFPGNVRLNQLALLLLTPASLQGERVQIVGGPFQDALGNALSNGYLVMQLQHDAVALNVGQIVGNMAVHIPLDINGYIQGTVTGAPVYIWPNNVLLPPDGNYLIWAYDSVNRLAWDNPQVQQVLSSPSPFNVDAWIPGP
jgi:hypothetical protein